MKELFLKARRIVECEKEDFKPARVATCVPEQSCRGGEEWWSEQRRRLR
jgi:hypothetical protein